ncbi:MAG: trypsin-like peptidase domain-containing protein [bacterium]
MNNIKKTLILTSICSLFFLSSLGGVLVGYKISKNSEPKNFPIASQPVKKIKNQTPTPLGSNLISDVAESAIPWVVNVKMQYDESPCENSDFPFPPFFDFNNQLPPQMRMKISGGSGIIIRRDGYILTSNHVIANARNIEINLNNDKAYKAKVIGVDDITDIAVLKINTGFKNLPIAKIGDSSNLRIGEWVIAVGSPLGYDQTVTQGIISAINRKVRDIPTSVDFIQTDAAINPGSSGGPLINLNGEVIGINTAIRADAQNIGFATPINTAKEVAEQIIKDGYVSRPWIGIEMKEIQIPTNSIVIYRIFPKSPADKGGLKSGDVILKIDGIKIEDAKILQKKVRDHKIGDIVRFQVSREGKIVNLKIKTEKIPNFNN